MPSNKEPHLSPITGETVWLPRAASAAPVQKPDRKHESKPRSQRHSTHAGPPPPPYYSSFVPPAQVVNPVSRQFNNCTFNISNGHSSRPSHHSSRYQPLVPRPAKTHSTRISRSSTTSSSTASVLGTANGAIQACNECRHSHSSKEKSVHFTESVSAREKEQKRWDPAGGHRTNHESKSGKRPEATKLERLMCESCQVRSQKWREGGSRMRLCDGCYRFREGKRAGRR